MAFTPLVLGGERRGRPRSEEGCATPFLGEEETLRRCVGVLAAASPTAPSVSRGGRSRAGPTQQGEERVEAAGPAGGQGPVGREAGGWAWGAGGGPREEEGSGPVADHTGRAEKGKEAGLKPFLGLKSNRVKENQF
jgi:hypothetical protein